MLTCLKDGDDAQQKGYDAAHDLNDAEAKKNGERTTFERCRRAENNEIAAKTVN